METGGGAETGAEAGVGAGSEGRRSRSGVGSGEEGEDCGLWSKLGSRLGGVVGLGVPGSTKVKKAAKMSEMGLV